MIHLCFFLQETKDGVDFICLQSAFKEYAVFSQKHTNSHSTLCLFVVVLLFCYNSTIHHTFFKSVQDDVGCTQFNSQPTKTQQVGHTFPPCFEKCQVNNSFHHLFGNLCRKQPRDPEAPLPMCDQEC